MSEEFAKSQVANDLLKLVCSFLSRSESEAFREPVDWEGLGLDDYPKIIKHPMDLGTIRKKLETGKYTCAEEVAGDIRLVWSNCMIFNQDGSDFYHLADKFSRKFENSYASIQKRMEPDDPNRLPCVDDRIKLSYDLFKVDNMELGKVLTIIEQLCPDALNRRAAEDEVLINIDMMTPQCFHEVSAFLTGCKTKKKRASTGGEGGSSADVAGGPAKKSK